MAQYETHRTCGHTETVQLYGKFDKRMETIKWLETQPCTACKRKQEQDEAEKAAILAGRVPMEGTPKQIAWATQIREEFFKKFEANPQETIRQVLILIEKRLLAERPVHTEADWQFAKTEAEEIKRRLTEDTTMDVNQTIEQRIVEVANNNANAKEWIENRTVLETFVADEVAVWIIGRDVDDNPVTFPAGSFGKCKNGVFWLATTGFIEATDQKYRCELAFVKAENATENPDGTLTMSRRAAHKALDDAANRTNANAPSFVTVRLRGSDIE